MSRRGCSLSANASGFDPHRASVTSRFGQVCDDIVFERCRSLDNTNLGFHPGSGSQNPVFTDCIARGNSQVRCGGLGVGEVDSQSQGYGAWRRGDANPQPPYMYIYNSQMDLGGRR
jgi:hypothetical protein